MSYPSPYPMPRRIVLSLGLLLVRWARRPVAVAQPVRAVRFADPKRAARAQTREAEAHVRAVRQHRVDRRIAAERARAEQRALAWPGHP